MELIIRKGTMNDFHDVQTLYHKLFLVEYKRDQNINTSWPREVTGEQFLTRIITGVDTICFVAQINRVIVGFLIGSLGNDPIRPCRKAQLISIYVDESFQNQTIGTKLVNAFIAWAKEKRAEKIAVIVQHDNKKGRSFYDKHGFHNHLYVLEKDI